MAMTERRYTDEEVAEIFRTAAEGPATPVPHSSPSHGLSLADLKAIGREVGIAPDAVARAAQALEVRRNAVSRTLIGLPIGVERRVTLSRRLTRSEEHTSEPQSLAYLVCRLLLEKKKSHVVH